MLISIPQYNLRCRPFGSKTTVDLLLATLCSEEAHWQDEGLRWASVGHPLLPAAFGLRFEREPSRVGHLESQQE